MDIRQLLEKKKREIEAKLAAAEQGSTDEGASGSNCSSGSSTISERNNSPQLPTNQVPSASDSACDVTRGRKRKSRWDPEPSAESQCEAVYPVPSADPTNFELLKLKAQLAAKEVVLKAKTSIVEPAIGSDEHKRRAMEMERTKQLAEKLTVPLLQGGHHMQDFLPPEVMAKFTKHGGASSAEPTTQYESNKLDQGNVGYQMLKKFGWTEGQGLGASGTGISAPIASVSSGDRAGLGTRKPDEPSPEDDEFELYRKRMMTAYKYRPNPLNNPRRPYY